MRLWRSAHVPWAQAAARPEDRPEWLEREPAALSFWPGHGPARARTDRAPPSFPQGASRRETAPQGYRSISAPGAPPRPRLSNLRPPRRTGPPNHARWTEAQRLWSFALSGWTSRTPRWIRAPEITGPRNESVFDAPTGALHILSGHRYAGFLSRICLLVPAFAALRFRGRNQPHRRDPGWPRSGPSRNADHQASVGSPKTGSARPATPPNRLLVLLLSEIQQRSCAHSLNASALACAAWVCGSSRFSVLCYTEIRWVSPLRQLQC